MRSIWKDRSLGSGHKRQWVKIWRMRVQMRARQIARICAMWMLIAHCLVAQTSAPPSAPPSNGEEIQLHTYLERAAEAMHKGDNPAAAKDLRLALKIDPHSL